MTAIKCVDMTAKKCVHMTAIKCVDMTAIKCVHMTAIKCVHMTAIKCVHMTAIKSHYYYHYHHYILLSAILIFQCLTLFRLLKLPPCYLHHKIPPLSPGFQPIHLPLPATVRLPKARSVYRPRKSVSINVQRVSSFTVYCQHPTINERQQ